MDQLVCPLCSETITDPEGAHFYQHFRYKRFACGLESCLKDFYTAEERDAHINEKGHKRLFQKTVNPYIEELIATVVEDARALVTKDMSTVIYERWGNVSSTSPPKPPRAAKVPQDPTNEPKNSKNKRGGDAASSSTPVPKKAKSGVAGAAQKASFVRPTPSQVSTSSARNQPVVSSTRRDPSPQSPAQPVSSSSSINLPLVDSTTKDTPAVPEKPTRKPRNKRDSGTARAPAPPTPKTIANVSYQDMSVADKMAGWFDPNVPERRNAAKVRCAVCNAEVVYDYVLRYTHVTQCHITERVSEKDADYDDIVDGAMEKSWPGLPNLLRNCQLCMEPETPIPRNKKREHIETIHKNTIEPLKCPLCDKYFERQTRLTEHMNKEHNQVMRTYREPNHSSKSSPFQTIRARRNYMIQELEKKCFPLDEFRNFEKRMATAMDKNKKDLETTCQKNPTVDSSFLKDIRIRDSHKTRRAPQYNQNESSDSSDGESDDEDSSLTPSNSNPEEVAETFKDDIILVGYKFNEEVADKLRLIRPMVSIKKEIIEAGGTVVQEEEPKKETSEEPQQPKQVDSVDSSITDIQNIPIPPPPAATTTTNTVPPIFSLYEPTVPLAPQEYSPGPIHSNVPPSEPFSLHVIPGLGSIRTPVPHRIISPEVPRGVELNHQNSRERERERPRTPQRARTPGYRDNSYQSRRRRDSPVSERGYRSRGHSNNNYSNRPRPSYHTNNYYNSSGAASSSSSSRTPIYRSPPPSPAYRNRSDNNRGGSRWS